MLRREPWLEASQARIGEPASPKWIETHRHPGLDVGPGKGEALRHDADDAPRLTVDVDRRSENREIPAESCLPHAMAQNHELVLTWFVLMGGEGPPDRGLHADDFKEL